MKFSKRILWKLKNKHKTLKPNRYKKLKRDSLRGLSKSTDERPRLSVYRSNKISMHKLSTIKLQQHLFLVLP